MADRSIVLRPRVALYHEGAGAQLEAVLTLARHPSETPARLAARLVLWALVAEPEARFRTGVCAGDEPDLRVAGPDGAIRVWGDVGRPDPERLERAARRCARVRVLGYGPRGRGLARVAAARGNLRLWWTMPAALEDVAGLLAAHRGLSLTVVPGAVYVAAGGALGEVPLESVSGT